MEDIGRRLAGGRASGPVPDDELVPMAACLFERAAEGAGPRTLSHGGIAGSREAAEWRTRLFEEIALLAP